MTEKTTQKIGDNSTAIQARRDVNISYGLSPQDAVDIAYRLFKENFPKLQDEAKRIAETNVQNFINNLGNKIRKNIKSVDINKFKDPDIQASLNEAVKAAAKKGDKANFNVLSELIIKRLSEDTGSFLSVVADEAIFITPKLTKEHITFISYVQFLTNMVLTDVKCLSDVDRKAVAIIQAIGNPVELNIPNKLYLNYTGCTISYQIRPERLEERIIRHYPFFELPFDPKTMKPKMVDESPAFYKIFDFGEKSNVMTIGLTSVGQIIALTNLKRGAPDLDLSIWIN